MSAKLHAYHIHDGTYRYAVAAKNLREAAELLNCSVHYLRQDGGRLEDDRPAAKIALSEPGRVWRQRIAYGMVPEPWVHADSPRGETDTQGTPQQHLADLLRFCRDQAEGLIGELRNMAPPTPGELEYAMRVEDKQQSAAAWTARASALADLLQGR